MTRRTAPRIAWLGAAAILVVAALVALGAILRGDLSDTDVKILGTLAAVLYTGGAFFAGLSVLERGHRGVGWAVAAAAPICFVLLLPAIWSVFDESAYDAAWRWAWSAVIALLAVLMLATARLLARADGARVLALVTGCVAGIAATLSVAAIWTEDGGDGWAQLIAALWILAVLAYVLVPVVDRFSRAAPAVGERVLASLGDVELVASRVGTLDPQLAPGERLLLRRRA